MPQISRMVCEHCGAECYPALLHADPNAVKCPNHGTVEGVRPVNTRLEQAQHARKEARAYAQLIAGNGHDKLLEGRIRNAFLAGWDAATRSTSKQEPR